jgi:hypothetical protein
MTVRWDIMWAESGEQRYRRELATARRRKDGGYDMRYVGSRYLVGYEAGEHRDYGLIKFRP